MAIFRIYYDDILPVRIVFICDYVIMTNKAEECRKYWMSEDNRQTLYKIAADMTLFLDREKIRYHASDTKLMGILRHADVVPHDDDLDVNYIIEKVRC